MFILNWFLKRVFKCVLVKNQDVYQMAFFVRLIIDCISDENVSEEEIDKMREEAYDLLLDFGFDDIDFDQRKKTD